MVNEFLFFALQVQGLTVSGVDLLGVVTVFFFFG
jgi:hypothetical protein